MPPVPQQADPRGRIIGERFYIYAARKWAGVRVQRSEVRDQRSETANDTATSLTSDFCLLTSPPQYPTGVIVGTAVISKCVVRPVLRTGSLITPGSESRGTSALRVASDQREASAQLRGPGAGGRAPGAQAQRQAASGVVQSMPFRTGTDFLRPS